MGNIIPVNNRHQQGLLDKYNSTKDVNTIEQNNKLYRQMCDANCIGSYMLYLKSKGLEDDIHISGFDSMKELLDFMKVRHYIKDESDFSRYSVKVMFAGFEWEWYDLPKEQLQGMLDNYNTYLQEILEIDIFGEKVSASRGYWQTYIKTLQFQIN